MGAETELLEWKRLKSQQAYFNNTDSQWKREKVQREANEELLKEHENYMLTQGFEFNHDHLKLPNGEKYAL